MVIYWEYIKCYSFVNVWKFFVKEKAGEIEWNLWKFARVGRCWKWLTAGPNCFLNGFVDGSGSKKRWGKEKQWMEAWER